MFWYVVLAILINISRSNSGREFFNSFCSWLVRDWSFL